MCEQQLSSWLQMELELSFKKTIAVTKQTKQLVREQKVLQQSPRTGMLNPVNLDRIEGGRSRNSHVKKATRRRAFGAGMRSCTPVKNARRQNVINVKRLATLLQSAKHYTYATRTRHTAHLQVTAQSQTTLSQGLSAPLDTFILGEWSSASIIDR